MRFFSTLSIFALATALVSAAPQPQATPAPELERRSLYDTGLTAGGAKIYFTKDPIGDLKSAAATGGDVQSLASAAASSGLDDGLQSVRPYTTLDAELSSSVSADVYSQFDRAASIATISDSAAYKSAGEAYTASLVESLSAALSSVTSAGLDLGGSSDGESGAETESDACVRFAIPALLSLLTAVSASAWMVL